MARSCVHVYIHYVWATWDRAPLLTPGIEEAVHACIREEVRKLRCGPIALDGTEDHIHCLLRLRGSVSIAEAAKQMKGSSSHLVTHRFTPGVQFRWQGAYGAFSVEEERLDRVIDYIRRQKEHHACGSIVPAWERCEEVGDEEDW